MLDTTSEVSTLNDLQLPAELTGEPPRRLPDDIGQGPLAETRRRAFWGCLSAGAVCLILSTLPFVDTLATYVLPLRYLSWIGVALIIAAIASSFTGGELKKASRYVQDGRAAFAQVVDLVKYPAVLAEGQPAQYAFRATVRVLHPNTDELVSLQVKSRTFASCLKDQVETRFRVNDVVPVVWLPNTFEETLQIYDFLDLTPAASLSRSVNARQKPLLQTILAVIFVPLFFFALFWNIYALGRFQPLDFDYIHAGLWPMSAGGLLGVAATASAFFIGTRKRQQIEKRNLEAASAGKAIELPHQAGRIRRIGFWLIMLAGAILICAGTALCWCFTANAMLDRSKPTYTGVKITDMIQTTHSFLFREYQLKYRRPGEKRDNELLTTPEHLSKFDAPIGVAEIHSGWLSWPWVKTVEPLVVRAGNVKPREQ